MRKYIITLLTLIVQLPCMAQQAIDLGLSVAWADRNLGAESSTATGYMLAWGELEPKNEYTRHLSSRYRQLLAPYEIRLRLAGI